MTRYRVAMLTSFACLGALAGCGDSEISRGTSGAAIGAGTGAAVCAVTVVGILPCAIVGGALGAAGGVSTAGPDEPTMAANMAAPGDAAPTPGTPAATAPAPAPAPADPIAAPQPQASVTAEPLQ